MYVYIQVQLNPQNFFKALNTSSILVTSILIIKTESFIPLIN